MEEKIKNKPVPIALVRSNDNNFLSFQLLLTALHSTLRMYLYMNLSVLQYVIMYLVFTYVIRCDFLSAKNLK